LAKSAAKENHPGILNVPSSEAQEEKKKKKEVKSVRRVKKTKML